MMRIATCVCRSDCEIAVLDDYSYRTVVGNKLLMIFAEEMNFYSKFSMFSKCPKWFIYLLAKFTEVVNINEETMIFEFNDEADYIYFIKQGEVRVSFQLAGNNNYNNEKEEDNSEYD
jgi:CRP-like cAMP-binding protein